jgi:glycosyltransferase involved in cell wall biosynthesis
VSAVVASVAVVIPARNEERLLPACLDSVLAASRCVDVPVRVTVVLDSCIDATMEICRRFEVETVQVETCCVGSARAAGVRAAVHNCSSPGTLWLANTDADSRVTSSWLRNQVALAEGGADVVLGVVDLDTDGSESVRRVHEILYAQRARPGGVHGHVHGANLGVRGSAYLASGGFPFLAAHEDRQLVRQLEALGSLTIVRSDHVRVTTSARVDNRCGAGVGADLAMLVGADR